jgi:hypothetical protein
MDRSEEKAKPQALQVAKRRWGIPLERVLLRKHGGTCPQACTIGVA